MDVSVRSTTRDNLWHIDGEFAGGGGEIVLYPESSCMNNDAPMIEIESSRDSIKF